MSERRYYSQSQLERAARQIELWRESLALAYRRELWDTAKTANFARDALQRAERFTSEHDVARAYLSIDVPRRRKWLNAALHILDFGDAKLRADFIVADEVTRERLVSWVVGRGGIYDRAHRVTDPAFVELPE